MSVQPDVPELARVPPTTEVELRIGDRIRFVTNVHELAVELSAFLRSLENEARLSDVQIADVKRIADLGELALEIKRTMYG